MLSVVPQTTVSRANRTHDPYANSLAHYPLDYQGTLFFLTLNLYYWKALSLIFRLHDSMPHITVIMFEVALINYVRIQLVITILQSELRPRFLNDLCRVLSLIHEWRNVRLIFKKLFLETFGSRRRKIFSYFVLGFEVWSQVQ